MTNSQNKPTPPDDDEHAEEGGPSRANLAALVFILVLFAGAYWLFMELQRHRQIENCIDSGRRDCIPLTAGENGAK